MTRRLFGTLCGLVFLVNFGRTAFAPLLPTFQSAFDVGPAAVGAVASLVWLGTGLARLPVGYLLTRVPRHSVVLVTGVLLAVASALTAASTGVPTLRVGAAAVGVASGAYFAAAVPFVGELYPERVGRAVGVHGVASQLAAVAAPAAVVAVLAVSDWRAVFWLLSGGSLLVTAALAVAVRGASFRPAVVTDHSFRDALAHWRLVAAAILMVATVGFVWQGLFNFYVSYMLAAKDLPYATASVLLTAVFAAGVPAFWASGRLADRLPNVPYILGLFVAFVGCLFALTAARGLVPLVVVTVALGYVIHSMFPALDTYVLESLPTEARASTYAVFSGLSLLIEANGSGVVGYLTEAGYPFEAVFRGLGFALCGVFVLLLVLYRTGHLPGTRPARRRRVASDP